MAKWPAVVAMVVGCVSVFRVWKAFNFCYCLRRYSNQNKLFYLGQLFLGHN